MRNPLIDGKNYINIKMNENEKYLIEDGLIKIDKATWDHYQYLKTKERMEIEQKLANAKFTLWQAENKTMKNEKMWENISLQETIRMAFPRGWDKIRYWRRKPQAYTLEKALETLQTILATQDIDLMIDWAYGKYSLPPSAHITT